MKGSRKNILTIVALLADIHGNSPALEALPKNVAPWNTVLVELIRWYQARLSPADLEWIRLFPDFVRWKEADLAHASLINRLFPQRWHTPGIAAQYQEWFYYSPSIQPDMAEPEWQKLLGFMEEQHLRQVFYAHYTPHLSGKSAGNWSAIPAALGCRWTAIRAPPG